MRCLRGRAFLRRAGPRLYSRKIVTRIYEADLRVKYKMETPNPIRHKSATVILKLTFASTTDRLC